MPAQQIYAAPHEQLGKLAVEARRNGVPFEEFWVCAVRPHRSPIVTKNTIDPPAGAIIWPHDSNDRATAIKAALEAKDVWRRAYEGIEPTRAELAIGVLWQSIRSGNGNGAGLSLAA